MSTEAAVDESTPAIRQDCAAAVGTLRRYLEQLDKELATSERLANISAKDPIGDELSAFLARAEQSAMPSVPRDAPARPSAGNDG